MSLEKSKRPLSPHLQVYKPQMTSMLSILHRLTGVALVFGLVLVAAILISAGIGEAAYNEVMGLSTSWLGQLVLLCFSFSLIFHTLNGVRHLIWDTGRLFKIEDATRAGYLVFWGAVILTAALWIGVKSGDKPPSELTKTQTLIESLKTSEQPQSDEAE